MYDNTTKRVALEDCQNIEKGRGFPTGRKCSNTILYLAKNDRRWRGLSFGLGLLGMWFPKRRCAGGGWACEKVARTISKMVGRGVETAVSLLKSRCETWEYGLLLCFQWDFYSFGGEAVSSLGVAAGSRCFIGVVKRRLFRCGKEILSRHLLLEQTRCY